MNDGTCDLAAAAGERSTSFPSTMDHPETWSGVSDPATLQLSRRGPTRVIRTLAAANGIQAEWDRMAAAGPWRSPIQYYLWSRTYAEVFGVDRRLHVVVSGNGRRTAIAPLFRPKGLFRSLELVGVEHLFEVMDFVHTGNSDLDSLAAALVGARRPIVLRRIRADSPAVVALRRACAREWITFCRPSRGCPYITLDESWSEPERHVNAGRRSDLRRARRAAEKIGPVTCEIVAPTPDQVPALLDEAYRVEAVGWKGREKTALATDKRLGDFYRQYAAAAAARGILRVCLLRIGGEAAAMQIVAVTGDRFWLLKIGYSEMHARCSPGVLLMLETIRYATRAGLRSYEFLGAAETWIRNWTALEHACVSFRAYPLTVGGLAALARDGASAAGRSALQRRNGR